MKSLTVKQIIALHHESRLKIKTDSAVRNISAYIVPLRQERDYW
ncbi:hypothetical protein BPUTSESOX_1942 [uncultured Gammaproteobacteria bacterium]|jgi:hypothetical protein|nr:hypothetical protein BPUTSESOX_1942 [uncultured Gammaproteobacteria bacterium]